MNFYNNLLLEIGGISIIFQLINMRVFKTAIDIICLIGSISLIILAFCFKKENFTNWHIKNYRIFYFGTIMSLIISSIRLSGFNGLIRFAIYVLVAVCCGYFVKYKLVE